MGRDRCSAKIHYTRQLFYDIILLMITLWFNMQWDSNKVYKPALIFSNRGKRTLACRREKCRDVKIVFLPNTSSCLFPIGTFRIFCSFHPQQERNFCLCSDFYYQLIQITFELRKCRFQTIFKIFEEYFNDFNNILSALADFWRSKTKW